MLGLLVQNQSHRAGTPPRGKLLRRIAHQTFFSGEMVSANPGAVHDRESVGTLGAVGIDRHNVPADLVSAGSERRHRQHQLLVVSGVADGRSRRDGPGGAGGNFDAGKTWLNSLAEG